jgi:hypothetical protein
VSGGSHDYLFTVTDAQDLVEKRAALERMADDLAGHEWAKAAAVETMRLAAALRRLDALIAVSRPLADVWHAYEWWQSLDSSEARAREACRKYAELSELQG